MVNGKPTLAGYLNAHLSRLGAGDYFALLAYIEMNDAHERALQAMRHRVRDAKRVATCLDFGPRFLHSTGQAYKGGPNTGVFLQITCDDAVDLPVPGQKYTFGVVKAAQARGDFQVLVERDRRALRAHLGADVKQGSEHFLQGAGPKPRCSRSFSQVVIWRLVQAVQNVQVVQTPTPLSSPATRGG